MSSWGGRVMKELRRSPQRDEIPLFTAAYDLNHSVLDRVARFPRGIRPLLGDRMVRRALDLVEIVVQLRYQRDRHALFSRGNLVLEQLRILVRISYEKRWISSGQYAGLAERIDGVGRMLGGWRRSVEGHRTRRGSGGSCATDR